MSVTDPQSTPEPSAFTPPSAPGGDNSASPLKRLLAFLLDTLAMLVVFGMLIQYLGIFSIAPGSAPDVASMEAAMLAALEQMTFTQRLLVVLLPYVIFFALHGYLLSRYGQTLGKRLLGIAIVTLDGRKPAFWPLITQRYLVQWLVGGIPQLGFLLRVVDVLFIFRDDRRCIHDQIAKTRVIDLKIPQPGAQDNAATGNTLIV